MIYISPDDWQNLDGGKACYLLDKLQELNTKLALIKSGDKNHRELIYEIRWLYRLFFDKYGHYPFEFNVTDNQQDLDLHQLEVSQIMNSSHGINFRKSEAIRGQYGPHC